MSTIDVHDAKQVRAELLGAWRLVSWQVLRTAGSVSYPLGDDAAGQLMYDGSGRVSAQLTRVNQPRFAHEDWQKAAAQEMAAAWLGYFGYFGTFSIDTAAGAVTHHIEGSWFPNLVGTEQVRHYAFEGDRLILDADTSWGKVRIIWEKIPSAA